MVSPVRTVLIPLPSDAACQLDIFRHDCDPLGVYGVQVGVLKEADQVCLRGLLERYDGPTLESYIFLPQILGNFPHKSLERQLPDEQLS